MYRFNNLHRPVLITASEVITKVATETNVDVRILENCIEVAEEKYIVPVVGRKFYEELIAQKNVTVTEDNREQLLEDINASFQQEGQQAITLQQLRLGSIINAVELVETSAYSDLWFRYLWRITADAVDAMATIPSWLRHTAQGQQKHNPHGFAIESKIVTGTREDVRYKMDYLVQGRIGSLVDAMREWIYERRADFPLYPFGTNCRPVDVAARKAGILLNIYDRED